MLDILRSDSTQPAPDTEVGTDVGHSRLLLILATPSPRSWSSHTAIGVRVTALVRWVSAITTRSVARGDNDADCNAEHTMRQLLVETLLQVLDRLLSGKLLLHRLFAGYRSTYRVDKLSFVLIQMLASLPLTHDTSQRTAADRHLPSFSVHGWLPTWDLLGSLFEICVCLLQNSCVPNYCLHSARV